VTELPFDEEARRLEGDELAMVPLRRVPVLLVERERHQCSKRRFFVALPVLEDEGVLVAVACRAEIALVLVQSAPERGSRSRHCR